MGKRLFISEKPSVAQEFANALELNFTRRDGYLEAADTLITWCVGHLVSMAYPEAYDESLRRWTLSSIPFIPDRFIYQVIDNVKKQYAVVTGLLLRPDVDTVYVCTDSGREGEYIYRLVAAQAGLSEKAPGKKQLRVWIDSQTKEEILRGIREAKPESEYDNLGSAAYLRAKEDYLMGINFSRAMTLKYARPIKEFLGMDRCVIAVGRVMTCVLGMVVSREREIREFVKTPFYRLFGSFGNPEFSAEWHYVPDVSKAKPADLYMDKGFKTREAAEAMAGSLHDVRTARVEEISRKNEKRNTPLLYNLAELQNDCARFFHISPDQTLQAAQELYEKKLTTYPRTDARVLSSAVAKEIGKNLRGIGRLPAYAPFVSEILAGKSVSGIGKSRYTDDKAITDHYAIIPTGQGLENLKSLSPLYAQVYELIVRRFLSVFYPPAVYRKIAVSLSAGTEAFSASTRALKEEGYLKVLQYSFRRSGSSGGKPDRSGSSDDPFADKEEDLADETMKYLESLKKGSTLPVGKFTVKEGETTPPKRYNSGSMILAMENAGQLIEEEELREQIKGSGIGTSATRAEILNKLVRNRYLSLNKKTQILTPTQLGEMIYDTVLYSLKPLLDPKLTASWEIGLSRVAEGTVTEEEYSVKLKDFIVRRTEAVKHSDQTRELMEAFRKTAPYYKKKEKSNGNQQLSQP